MKKLWISTALTYFNGTTNAALALTLQFWDTLLLLYLRPYTDRMTDMTECVGSITNLLAYLSISVPVFVGPHIEMPSFLGDLTNIMLASFATILVATVSMARPLRVLFVLVGYGISRVASQLGCLESAAPVKAMQESKQDIMSNVYDETQAHVEEGYTKDDPEDEKGESVEAAGTLVLSAAAAAAGAVGAASKAWGVTESSVEAEVTLAACSVMEVLGTQQDVERLLIRGLADAVGFREDCFQIQGARYSEQEDSIIYDITIYKDWGLPTISPQCVLEDLAVQAKDPMSRLRRCKVTWLVNSICPKFCKDTSPPVAEPSSAQKRHAKKCYPIPKDEVIIPLGFSEFAGNKLILLPGLQGPVGVNVTSDFCFLHKDRTILSVYNSNGEGGGDETARSMSPFARNSNLVSSNNITGPTPHGRLHISHPQARWS